MWTYSPLSLAANAGVIVAAIALAIRFSPRSSGMVRSLRQSFRKVAARPWVFGILLALVATGMNLLLTLLHFPQPFIHDEQANLLAADTLAHGRLTNPPHPFWEHFETFHVISQPTRTAKYPPAPAAFMALGTLLTGYPVAGVWIAYVLSVVAFYWMLRAWIPARWAALGGILVALHAPMLQGWGQSYWGGSVAMLGGALVFGGIRRIWNASANLTTRRSETAGKLLVQDGVLLALGMVLLAHSRPMEGAIVCLPAMGILAVWFFRDRSNCLSHRLAKVALPIAFIGLAGLASLAIYNRAVTGDAWQMPYKLHDEVYSASSLLIWRPLPAIPEYRHERMKDFYMTWGRARQELLQSDPLAFLENLGRKAIFLVNFFPLGSGLLLIAMAWIWRDRWFCLAISLCGLVVLIHTQTATSLLFPHYLAPVTALFLAVNVRCFRQIFVWQRASRTGQLLVRAAIIASLLLNVPMAVRLAAFDRPHPHEFARKQLDLSDGSRHLVFVTYGDSYPGFDDWVFNEADIDEARIVFARDMGTVKNRQLAEYFSTRHVWHWHLENETRMSLVTGLPVAADDGGWSHVSSADIPENKLKGKGANQP
jgi:hypothetical protein